ncbi:hypothetical protein AXG93_1626s1000 [Marchantia polymorpha subsp. ruderalis]|nr:hypothetical protein AXG93_1626s1000 [Marchantia polymorpha subsp. ruderalis]
MHCPRLLCVTSTASPRAEQSSDERVVVRTGQNGSATRRTAKCAMSVCFRREIFYLGAALMGAGTVAVPEVLAEDVPALAGFAESDRLETVTSNVGQIIESGKSEPVRAVEKVDTTITDRVYLDLSICPNNSRKDRTLGNTSQICTVGEPLGRIVIGLYGRQVPQTVKNFKAMCTGQAGTSYAGTTFHRVLPGQYIQAGKQGSKDKGEVSGLIKLDRNKETVNGNAYKLTHTRPGTVSLCLSENDDEEDLKLDVDYRNVQFLITTGPGPATQLDNGNIVFGTVLEGLDVVAAVAKVPTYKPSEKIRQFNDFAEFLGDDRAANARNFWNRPLKTVVITKCGELPMGLPVFPPGLP